MNATQFFCLNSGGCGSTYMVDLLKINNVQGCYHEKWPDMDRLGVYYYLGQSHDRLIKAVLNHTRRNVFFESNNRLFPFARLIQEISPNAKFIHLHRNGYDIVNSLVNKNNFDHTFKHSKRLRYRSQLCGPSFLSSFERACHYWANINRYIHQSLQDKDHLQIRFDDLVSGRIDHLASFMDVRLDTNVIPPVNTKQHLKSDNPKYRSHQDWPDDWRNTFQGICGEVMENLGY